MVEGFAGFAVAPAFDGKFGEGGTVLGTDNCEKGVQGRGVFESECIAGIEDGLGLGVDGLVEKDDVGHEGGYYRDAGFLRL